VLIKAEEKHGYHSQINLEYISNTSKEEEEEDPIDEEMQVDDKGLGEYDEIDGLEEFLRFLKIWVRLR
jgi:hypothetical protein